MANQPNGLNFQVGPKHVQLLKAKARGGGRGGGGTRADLGLFSTDNNGAGREFGIGACPECNREFDMKFSPVKDVCCGHIKCRGCFIQAGQCKLNITPACQQCEPLPVPLLPVKPNPKVIREISAPVDIGIGIRNEAGTDYNCDWSIQFTKIPGVTVTTLNKNANMSHTVTATSTSTMTPQSGNEAHDQQIYSRPKPKPKRRPTEDTIPQNPPLNQNQTIIRTQDPKLNMQRREALEDGFLTQAQGPGPVPLPLPLVISPNLNSPPVQSLSSISMEKDTHRQFGVQQKQGKKASPAPVQLQVLTSDSDSQKSKKNLKPVMPDFIEIIANGPRVYKCTPCNKKFKTQQHAMYHVRTHTGERPYECKICKKRFNQKGKVTRHMLSHTGEIPFPCQRCDKKFTNAQSLRSHNCIHTGERPFPCQYCERRFINRPNLMKHVMFHTGKKEFACDSCRKKFNFKWERDQHVQGHSADRPYRCSICSNKSFMCAKDLKRHAVIHSTETPFPCPICGTSFKRADNKNRHVRMCHKNDLQLLNSCNLYNSTEKGTERGPPRLHQQPSAEPSEPEPTEPESILGISSVCFDEKEMDVRNTTLEGGDTVTIQVAKLPSFEAEGVKKMCTPSWNNLSLELGPSVQEAILVKSQPGPVDQGSDSNELTRDKLFLPLGAVAVVFCQDGSAFIPYPYNNVTRV